ncbi:hypothetical protein EH31_06965 [Erythrobacter longus]|uniref:HTH marR-type domain-containing protein n=1 Tax=Erythrobacter longus TaxID=1044 RepID=A0A074MYQ0_ERYLO|nr:hypothetical protein [Erythrobacter longus]KEO90772.1 hypothetical protein EH31_06965 [Erythrobacter longus]
MQSFLQNSFPGASFESEKGTTPLSTLKKRDAALSGALGLTTCLKPEAALMLELYEAGKEGRAVTVSVLGLTGGIAPTTTLRYLEALQKKGAVRRIAHKTDHRMTYVELTESAQAAMDAAFGG